MTRRFHPLAGDPPYCLLCCGPMKGRASVDTCMHVCNVLFVLDSNQSENMLTAERMVSLRIYVYTPKLQSNKRLLNKLHFPCAETECIHLRFLCFPMQRDDSGKDITRWWSWGKHQTRVMNYVQCFYKASWRKWSHSAWSTISDSFLGLTCLCLEAARTHLPYGVCRGISSYK